MRLPCKQTYTADDSDWNDRQLRGLVEMNNAQTRLTLKSTKADVAAYDVVSTGYVPFATSFSFIPDSVQIKSFVVHVGIRRRVFTFLKLW